MTGGFQARFQEMLKAPHKLIFHVKLFCRDDILAKMFYAIRILLSYHLNYLALKLFFFTSIIGWYL